MGKLTFEEWLGRIMSRGLIDTPAGIVEKLKEYVEIGVAYFMLKFGDNSSKEGMKFQFILRAFLYLAKIFYSHPIIRMDVTTPPPDLSILLL